MTDHYNLSRNTMWKATISCDPTYDGIFFYAVQSTGIFCRPSCKSRVPNYENVTFFIHSQEAQQAGYRPCKRCRPDLNIKVYDPWEYVLEDTIQLLKDNYSQPLSLGNMASQIGISSFHLNRVFKKRIGETPRVYLEKIRVKRAKQLLLTTDWNSTEVGYQIGYQSVSSFYHAFKRHTGVSPNQFRALHLNPHDHTDEDNQNSDKT